MLFYSTVAIVICTLLGWIGLFYIIRKENGLKNLKKAKLSNPRLYINIISFVMLFVTLLVVEPLARHPTKQNTMTIHNIIDKLFFFISFFLPNYCKFYFAIGASNQKVLPLFSTEVTPYLNSW